ncbi:MAG: CbiX/SirB N-terminal domain-containing protein [Bacillota bacterium]
MRDLAVVVLGHGSRATKPEANDAIEELGRMVGDLLDLPTAVAFLNRDSGRKGMEEACHEAVRQGQSTLVILPLFLAGGVHVTEDIPAMVQEVEASLGCRCLVARPIGADRGLAKVIVERAREVIQGEGL